MTRADPRSMEFALEVASAGASIGRSGEGAAGQQVEPSCRGAIQSLRSLPTYLGRAGLLRRQSDDLNPSILVRQRVGRIFGMFLSVSDRKQASPVDTFFSHEEVFDLARPH